jgi:hypothetical protein
MKLVDFKKAEDISITSIVVKIDEEFPVTYVKSPTHWIKTENDKKLISWNYENAKKCEDSNQKPFILYISMENMNELLSLVTHTNDDALAY